MPVAATGHAHKILGVQFGAQTAWDAAVAATWKPMNVTEATLEPDSQVEMTNSVGNLAPATNADIVMIKGKLTIKGRLAYEEASYWYQFLVGAVTPTGAGPYVRDHTAPHGSAFTPVIGTCEYGYSGLKYKAINCFLVSYKESAEAGTEAVVFEAEFETGAVTPLTTYASLADRATNYIRPQDIAAYVDASGGTIGTTAYANTVRSYELEITTNNHAKPFLGRLDAGGYGIDGWEGKFTAQFEMNAASKTEVEAILNSTSALARLVQLKGTRSTQINKLNFCGVQNGSFKPWENAEGNVAVTFDILPKYDIGTAYWFNVNNTSTIPTLLM